MHLASIGIVSLKALTQAPSSPVVASLESLCLWIGASLNHGETKFLWVGRSIQSKFHGYFLDVLHQPCTLALISREALADEKGWGVATTLSAALCTFLPAGTFPSPHGKLCGWAMTAKDHWGASIFFF